MLLIDEVDRADEEFEAFLLEVLSDFQVSIPEIGTIRARQVPFVVLTSNRTRELSDALRRRCLYLWMDYPNFDKELRIVHERVPDIDERLVRQICGFMQLVRQAPLDKIPGVAETLDWSAALMALHRDHLDPQAITETLGCLCKDQEDLVRVKSQFLRPILDAVESVEASGDGWTPERTASLAAQLPQR